MAHSDDVCHMNLQCEMVVTDHNGGSHMLSEKCYPSVSLSVIIMFCLCSVDLRVELCCVRWSVCSTWLWHLKLGELQGSREYNEEDRRWFCSVYEVKLDVKVAIASFHAAASRLCVLVHWDAITRLDMVSLSCGLLSIYGLTWFYFLETGRVAQGTCVIDVGIDEDMWWLVGETAEFLEYFLRFVEEHRLIGSCVPVLGNGPYWWAALVMNVTLLGLDVQNSVMDVVGFRGCLCLQRRCDGILWNDATPLASTQPAKERPPLEPPPALWILPEPPPLFVVSSGTT